MARWIELPVRRHARAAFQIWFIHRAIDSSFAWQMRRSAASHFCPVSLDRIHGFTSFHSSFTGNVVVSFKICIGEVKLGKPAMKFRGGEKNFAQGIFFGGGGGRKEKEIWANAFSRSGERTHETRTVTVTVTGEEKEKHAVPKVWKLAEFQSRSDVYRLATSVNTPCEFSNPALPLTTKERKKERKEESNVSCLRHVQYLSHKLRSRAAGKL